MAFGECGKGGGFAHPTCGVVQAVRAGHVFVVNPSVPHATCEFGDPCASRRMIALYASKSALCACMTSAVVQERMGLSGRPPKKRRRAGSKHTGEGTKSTCQQVT